MAPSRGPSRAAPRARAHARGRADTWGGQRSLVAARCYTRTCTRARARRTQECPLGRRKRRKSAENALSSLPLYWCVHHCFAAGRRAEANTGESPEHCGIARVSKHQMVRALAERSMGEMFSPLVGRLLRSWTSHSGARFDVVSLAARVRARVALSPPGHPLARIAEAIAARCVHVFAGRCATHGPPRLSFCLGPCPLVCGAEGRAELRRLMPRASPGWRTSQAARPTRFWQRGRGPRSRRFDDLGPRHGPYSDDAGDVWEMGRRSIQERRVWPGPILRIHPF